MDKGKPKSSKGRSGGHPRKPKAVRKVDLFELGPVDQSKEETNRCPSCGFSSPENEAHCRECGIRLKKDDPTPDLSGPLTDEEIDAAGGDGDALQETLGELRESAKMGIGVARAVWPEIEKLVEENKDLLVDVVETVVGVVSDLDEGLSDQVNEMMKRHAKRSWDKFNTLLGLGFTREEAMQVLLTKSDSNAKLNESIAKMVSKALEGPKKKSD
ncbi:MAG: zinc ribbon domain-containing protein [Patescibacteria group bacterium]